MLSFSVTPKKANALVARMLALGIKEADLLEKFIRGSGAGGQKVNKTSSTVYIKHLPTGTEVKCQETRQLSLNRYYARCWLCDLLEREQLGRESAQERERFRARKQKARRNRKSKQKMLEAKARRSEVKAQRKSVKES
jgi:protein subunit release factor B